MFELAGKFFVKRWEHKNVLDAQDEQEAAVMRERALAQAMRGDFRDFELVESLEAQNTVSLEFYDLTFNTMLKGDTYTPNVRIGVFQNNVTPTDTLTISTFRSTLGEFTSYTVDSGNTTNRASTTFDAASGQSIWNNTTPSRFTFTANGTIYGGFVTQGATLKDGTQDTAPAVYVAGAKFDAAVPVSNGTILDVVYKIYKP